MREPADAGLLEELYAELRAIAARHMARERANHTLQPTALIHEAYLRLADANSEAFRDRTHFRCLASRVMRHVLVDHARGRAALKRGGEQVRVTFEEALFGQSPAGGDLLALDQALDQLAAEDARCGRVAEMRLFADATLAEIAEELDVAETTVRNEWRYARSWLRRALATG